MLSLSEQIASTRGAPRSLRLWIAAAIAVATLQFEGCGNSQASPTRASVPRGPSVGIAAAVLRSVRDSDEFSGRLEATEAVELRARVGGYIKKVNFHAGEEVAKGQLLFTIDPDTYRAAVDHARAELAAAQARSALAHTEQERARSLLAEKALSQEEYDQRSAALRTSQADVDAAQAALESALLDLGYSQVRAPIAGKVSRERVTEGNLVTAGSTLLTTIVSQDKVYAVFDASESVYLKYAALVAGPLSASPSHPAYAQLGLLNESGFPHDGVIESFDNRVDSETGSVRARALFDNARRQYTPGLYARVRLLSGAPYDAVLTPERAIGTNQDRKFVLVVGGDGVAQVRPVELGELVDGMRVISAGLKPGENVVVDGLQRVRPGAPVTPELLALDAHGFPLPAGAAPTTSR